MFAPLVAKARSTGPQPAKAADQTHTPRLSLGDQATSSFVAGRSRAGPGASGSKATGPNAARAAGQGTPFNDERHASGTVEVTRGAGASLVITPSITYTVSDTIDLCPGDCGFVLEQVAAVPLSQFEATGISGDVPFAVVFPAPLSHRSRSPPHRPHQRGVEPRAGAAPNAEAGPQKE
jgi:hypothetical protein